MSLIGEPTAWLWKHLPSGNVGVYLEDPTKFGIDLKHKDYEWTLVVPMAAPSTPAGPETVKALQQAVGAEAEPPSAVVSEEDGHICDMAMLHGAKLVNESGTRYEFTEAQLLAFTKANRQPG